MDRQTIPKTKTCSQCGGTVHWEEILKIGKLNYCLDCYQDYQEENEQCT